MTAGEQEAKVFAYYVREAAGEIELEALAGLGLDAFRAARSRLVAKGVLVVSRRGRYVPVAALESEAA